MIDRAFDWDKPKHSVEQFETETADKKPTNEVDPLDERVDEEGEGKVTRRLK